MEALRKEAARTREFLANSPPRQNRKGQELKTNVTDSQSAKMATNKGVIQGYAAQAAVDSAHQVIVAADVIGSGSEQAMLLPMIEQASAFRTPQTLITADAGYHSDANIQHLQDHSIPALIADNQMRSRDERFELNALAPKTSASMMTTRRRARRADCYAALAPFTPQPQDCTTRTTPPKRWTAMPAN
jgi:hypothetical protein